MPLTPCPVVNSQHLEFAIPAWPTLII
jgi:hypothetical protein